MLSKPRQGFGASSFSPREHAIYRRVWSLDAHDRSWLDKYFIMKAHSDVITKRFDLTSHEFKVLLQYDTIAYEVEFLDCSLDFIKKLHPASVILLSFRYSFQRRLAVCVVAIPHRKIWKDIWSNRPEFKEFV